MQLLRTRPVLFTDYGPCCSKKDCILQNCSVSHPFRQPSTPPPPPHATPNTHVFHGPLLFQERLHSQKPFSMLPVSTDTPPPLPPPPPRSFHGIRPLLFQQRLHSQKLLSVLPVFTACGHSLWQNELRSPSSNSFIKSLTFPQPKSHTCSNPLLHNTNFTCHTQVVLPLLCKASNILYAFPLKTNIIFSSFFFFIF